MDIVSDNYNRPAGLEPSSPIQDTDAVIQAWIPIEHQHKSHLYIPTVSSHIPAPNLDVYISVNPNMNEYAKHNDLTFETSTLFNDLTVNEYINQHNNVWDDDKDIIHKNRDNEQIQPGPVQFIKGSQKPRGNSYKPSKTLPKLYSYFYRGYINPSHNSYLDSGNGGEHESLQQIQKIYEQYQPRNYLLQQIHRSSNDGIRRNNQKSIWRGQNTYQNITSNSFLRDTPALNGEQYPHNMSHYIKYNTLNTNLRDREMKPDEVLLNTYNTYSHQLSLPMYALKVYKTPKETPEIHANPLYRPNLRDNIAHSNKYTETVTHAQDINRPEIYSDLNKNKKRIKLKKKKIGTLEKVLVEQKNVDDLVEQRDDLSQEIWEQNFISLGKEQNIGHGHEKKSNSKEQSEEVPSIWDLNINQINDRQEKGSQWLNHIENLNTSMQKLKNHKQAVEEYIYANTRSIPHTPYENKIKNFKWQRRNFSMVTKKRAGDIKDIELAYLREIQGTTEPLPADKKPTERAHSPLWNAMESYYSFAKDIIVSWFD